MKDLLQFPAELINYRTYTTKRNVQIQFELQEDLQPEHIAQLLASKGMTGWMVFSPTEQQVRPEDIPEAPVEPKNGKDSLSTALQHPVRLIQVLTRRRAH